MDTDQFESTRDAQGTNADPAAPGTEETLREEIGGLRLQLERLKGFQGTPRSDDPDLLGRRRARPERLDQPDPTDDHKRPRRRSSIRMVLAPVVAPILGVGGFRFWNYFHSYPARLAQTATFYNPRLQAALEHLAGRPGPAGLSTPDATQQAYGRIYAGRQRQAQTFAYIDSLWAMALLAVFPMMNWLGRPEPCKAAPAR